MKVTKTRFKGLLIVETDLYCDSRGWFTETYTKKKFVEKGINVDFVQDNHSYSAKKGTLRGIHFQINPKAQTKMIRCSRGAIVDTVVDLRKGSDTYKQWFSIELSAENKKQLFIPKGFGHAFLTITDDVEVQYKVDEYYSSEHDRSIRFDDPEIGIDWGIVNPILSEKDLNAPYLKNSDANFSIKVLVTGAKGPLGYDVVKELNELGIDNVGVDIGDFDITCKEETERYILNYMPDVVIHCATYTAVNKAEEKKEKCYTINLKGTRNIAEVCQKIDAKMVYISADYLFGGEGTESQPQNKSTNPIIYYYYGDSKEQGELVVKDALEKYFIIRLSRLNGINDSKFVKDMLKLSEVRDEISLVNDQIGAPTNTKDLAVLVCVLIQSTKYGIYRFDPLIREIIPIKLEAK